MSIERVERKGGVVWRVRWRQGDRNRSKVLGRKRDAEAFDAELRLRRRTGELGTLDAGKESLADFGEEWWRLYGEPNLAASTLQVYAALELHQLTLLRHQKPLSFYPKENILPAREGTREGGGDSSPVGCRERRDCFVAKGIIYVLARGVTA